MNAEEYEMINRENERIQAELNKNERLMRIQQEQDKWDEIEAQEERNY